MPKRQDTLADHLERLRKHVERGDVLAIREALALARDPLRPSHVEMPWWLADALAVVVERLCDVPLAGRGKATPRTRRDRAIRDLIIANYVERELADGWPKAEAYKRAREALGTGWQVSDDAYRRAHERARRQKAPLLRLAKPGK